MKKYLQIQPQYLLAQITGIIIWFAITVVQWSQNPKTSPGLGIPLTVRAVEALAIFVISGLFILSLEYVGDRYKKSRFRFLLLIFIYFGAIAANVISLSIRSLIGFAPPHIDNFFFIQSLHFYIPITFVLVLYALTKNRLNAIRAREDKLKAEALAQEAKWMMLRYQINPHFLFNTLNSTRALIGKNNDHAREIITELSEYFRYSLTIENKTVVYVTEEVSAVDSYLSIQKTRFQEKLNIEKRISSECQRCKIPAFSLQTLVENSIKYGFKTNDGGLLIEIDVFLKNHQLNLIVKNNGKLYRVEESQNQKLGSQTGLKNLKSRLKYLDPNFSFDLREEKGKVIAHIQLSTNCTLNENLENNPD